jgi:hypothetical protein
MDLIKKNPNFIRSSSAVRYTRDDIYIYIYIPDGIMNRMLVHAGAWNTAPAAWFTFLSLVSCAVAPLYVLPSEASLYTKCYLCHFNPQQLC